MEGGGTPEWTLFRVAVMASSNLMLQVIGGCERQTMPIRASHVDNVCQAGDMTIQSSDRAAREFANLYRNFETVSCFVGDHKSRRE